MDSAITASLVAGAFAIIAPIVTFIITKKYENRFLQPINMDRAKSLIGHWKGNIIQENGTFEIELTLDIVGKKISGTARVSRSHIDNRNFEPLDLSGGFFYERFLKLDYKNSNTGIVQFGSITLELDPVPKKMTGKYSGYGSFSKAIIAGSINVEKI